MITTMQHWKGLEEMRGKKVDGDARILARLCLVIGLDEKLTGVVGKGGEITGNSNEAGTAVA